LAGSGECRGGIFAGTKSGARAAAIVMLAIALLVASAATAQADWPSYRGGPSQNMSRTEDPGPHPSLLWQSVKSFRDEPCVIAAGESAFTIATPEGGGSQRLFRIDLASGETVWSTFAFPIEQRVACPTVEGSRVFLVVENFVVAFDVAGGEFLWATELDGEAGMPMASKGTVYASSSETLYALDSTDGSIRWKAPAFEASDRPPLLIGETVVNVGREATLIAYRTATGEPFWGEELPIPDAIGVGGSVVFSRAGKSVVSRDAGSGSSQWTHTVPPGTVAQRLVADDSNVYVWASSIEPGAGADYLIALDAETGATKYVREHEALEGCCGTPAINPPFARLGSRLYDQYRYFDAATGAPGGAHEIFFDGGFGCANEQDSIFAHGGSTIVVWKNLCSHSVLSAYDVESGPEVPGPVELVQPGPEALTGGRPQFGWKVGSPSAVSHYELVIDGDVFAEVTPEKAGPVFFTPAEDLSDGVHKWSVVAVDKSGGRTESETRTFTVDGSPPAPFGLLKPPNESVTNPKPEFSWEAATDVGPAGLDRYELIIDKEVVAKAPAGTESVGAPFELSQGTHTWSIAAIDGVGNRRETETRSFFVDTTGPQGIELIEPEPGASTGPRPQFRWYPATDFETAVDHYQLIIDEAPYAEIPAGKEGEILSFTPSEDLPAGSHSWSVRPFDVAGNFKESETRSFSVDSSPPAPPVLISPGEGAVVGARPEFDWEASEDPDLAYYELIVDGEAFVAKESSHTLAFDLGDGLHTWSVVAVDNHGNRAESKSRSFTADASAPTPFSLLEPADEAITGFDVKFAWEAASDVGAAGLDHYELMLNGEKLADIPAGTEFFAENGERVLAGLNTWSVAAIDKVGNRRESATRSFTVATPPNAVLSVAEMALTGAPVTFDASASTAPPGGAISGYEWDLDGDGSYELDTSTTPTASHTYSTVEELTVSVRVRSNLGTEDTATAQVSVRLAPPAGPLGVSINAGARFTNSANVTVSLVWPLFAHTVLISNDGGFRTAGSFPLAATIPWKLDPTGAERLPRTIYVRFQGGEAGRETYQDDIVLDEKKPKVAAATLTDDGSVLTVRALDGVSGVASMEVRNGDSGRPRWVPFRAKVRLRRSDKPVFVRVRDRAGNRSKWRKARIPR
jgi:outer membrane protein assembly factor BamB